MKKHLFIILINLLVVSSAGATPPPTKEESVICEIKGRVHGLSHITNEWIGKSNLKSYDNPTQKTLKYMEVRIEVETSKYNDQSRVGGATYDKNWCEALVGNVTEQFPLCVDKDIKYGEVVNAKFQRGYVNGPYCFDVQ